MKLTANEDVLDYLNKEITSLLVEVKGLELGETDTRLTGSLFHVVNDMERVGDHSMNLLDSARLKKEDDVKFSDKATKELETLAAKVDEQLQTALQLFRAQSTNADTLAKVEQVEEEIDQETEALRDHHVERLKNKNVRLEWYAVSGHADELRAYWATTRRTLRPLWTRKRR